MKEFVKPEIQVLEIRPEERIAACGDTEDYFIPGSPGSFGSGEWQQNGNSPNGTAPWFSGCWTWVWITPPSPPTWPSWGTRPVEANIS